MRHRNNLQFISGQRSRRSKFYGTARNAENFSELITARFIIEYHNFIITGKSSEEARTGIRESERGFIGMHDTRSIRIDSAAA